MAKKETAVCPDCGRKAVKTGKKEPYRCKHCGWEGVPGFTKYGTPEEDVSEDARGK